MTIDEFVEYARGLKRPGNEVYVTAEVRVRDGNGERLEWKDVTVDDAPQNWPLATRARLNFFDRVGPSGCY